jgi:hypothetical protein
MAEINRLESELNSDINSGKRKNIRDLRGKITFRFGL